MNWEDSLTNIKGVGPKRKEALKNRGLETVGDLLSFYPRKYIDRSVLGCPDSISE